MIITMCEISSRRVKSLKLRVRRCRDASREISESLFRLLPCRFSTCVTRIKLDSEQKNVKQFLSLNTFSVYCFGVISLMVYILTVIWLRTFALATVSIDFSSRMSILGWGFRMGSMFNTSSSRSSSALDSDEATAVEEWVTEEESEEVECSGVSWKDIPEMQNVLSEEQHNLITPECRLWINYLCDIFKVHKVFWKHQFMVEDVPEFLPLSTVAVWCTHRDTQPHYCSVHLLLWIISGIVCTHTQTHQGLLVLCVVQSWYSGRQSLLLGNVYNLLGLHPLL